MEHCILKSKITFIGQVGWEYIYISIKNKGFTVEKIDRKKAKEIIGDNNLILSDSNFDGKIYTSPNFKEYVNSYPKLKEAIINIVDKIDD